MKVIAVNANKYHSHHQAFSDVLVQMSYQEMAIILGEQYHIPNKVVIEPGMTIEIADRFRHAVAIENNVAGATKLPATLRTLADMLEMQHPAIEAVVSPPEPPSAE